MVPEEEAEEMDAVPAGSTSSGDAVVVPSSAMGGGPACVYPGVATDMHPAVAVVPAGEQQVGASQVEEAVTLPAEPCYTNAVHVWVGGDPVVPAATDAAFSE